MNHGDIVKVPARNLPTPIGARGYRHGIVVVPDNGVVVGVEFYENDVYGHSCDGNARGDSGWFCMIEAVQVLESCP